MNDSLSEGCNGTDIQQGAPLGWIMAAQAWAWTVSCVGGVGNLVTICAIAYQLYLGRVWRRRHGSAGRPVVALEGDTILLLHLSICDFLYCAVNLPITAITYNYALGRTQLQPTKAFCTGAALFRYVNALAEWTTLGLLTVQRCVDLGRSRGARFFRPRPTVMFIAGIWVGSVVLQLGAIMGDQFDYDCESHKCDMMSDAWRIYFFSLESLLPCGLMLTGCCSIIFQIWRNTRKLLSAGMPPELASQRFRSMMKSTVLLLMLLFLFLTCVIPMCVYSVDSLFSERKIALGIAIFMLYWIQYGVNFIVYAASNENYRTAYKQFLMLLVNWVGCLRRAIHSGAVNGPGRNKADKTSPTLPPQVLPRGSSATSLAPLPLGTCRKGSAGPCFSNSAAHPHGPHPLLPCLHRLRSCNSEPLARSELDRRGHVLHLWPMWRSGSQSSRSSVLTFESVQHDSDANTTVTTTTTICPLSPTTLNTSSTTNTFTTATTPKHTNTTICPPSPKTISTSSTTTTCSSTTTSPTSITSSTTTAAINTTTYPVSPTGINVTFTTSTATSTTTSSTSTTSSTTTISSPLTSATDSSTITATSLTITNAITKKTFSTSPITTITTNTITLGASATTAV